MYATPTPPQIHAAQMVYIAESYYKMVKSEFDNWKLQIITSGQYHIDDQFYTEQSILFNADFPADKIVRDIKHCPFIRGFNFDEVIKDTDADRFTTALRDIAIEHGFKEGEKAEAAALRDLHTRQLALIDATYAIHYIRSNNLEEATKEQLINILVQMFASEIEKTPLKPLTIEYYNDRMLEKAQVKRAFKNDEESFKWFQSLKKITPVLAMLPTVIPNPDEEDKKKVEGIEFILTYMPDCHIFQMELGATWMYDNHKTTSRQYAFINLHEELIESNHLHIVERALFDEFLQHLNR